LTISSYVEFVFCFKAEDGIRDARESGGLGDWYKIQISYIFYRQITGKIQIIRVTFARRYA
ncbi:hypothetical protein, partial [Paramuribaculum intestinale]|uniref:hypothetical protein n=1 Tax=Paramuribaculum intestinale TaxID=2094151 RepID=UPI00197E3C52